MYIIKIRTLMIISHMIVIIHNPSRKTYLITQLIKLIVFVTDPEKVELRINEQRTWLKNNKYSDHIISNAFYNAKIQSPAPKPQNNFNNISFFTSYHEDTDNKYIMKKIKRKIKSAQSDYIKGVFQESNIFLSQRQPKNLVRLFSISRNPSLPKGIFKCNNKR